MRSLRDSQNDIVGAKMRAVCNPMSAPNSPIKATHPIIFQRSFTENAPVFSRAFCASAKCYGVLENLGVLPVVVAPLEFGDVERQILGTDMVEATHNAALQERPEAVDRLGMDQPTDILATAMLDGLMGEFGRQADIATMLIRSDEADLVGDCQPDEMAHGPHVGFAKHAGNDGAFAFDGTDDDLFAGSAGAESLLVPMSVLVLAADIGLVPFNDAHQLAELRVDQSGTDAVTHIVCGLVGPEAHHSMDLQRRDPLLAGQHEVDHLEPLAHRNVRVLEDCPDQDREAVAASLDAFGALPMERTIGDWRDLFVVTARAMNAGGPTTSDEVGFAGVISRKQRLPFGDRHLFGEPDLTHRECLHA
jgi:hypothetical protein